MYSFPDSYSTTDIERPIKLGLATFSFMVVIRLGGQCLPYLLSSRIF